MSGHGEHPLPLARGSKDEPPVEEDGTICSLLKTVPPLHRIDDSRRELVREMDAAGFGGKEKIAQIITRAGEEISTRSVGRFRKEPPLPPAPPAPDSAPPRAPQPTPSASSSRVRAKRPLHVAMLDITTLPSLFGLAAKGLYLYTPSRGLRLTIP